MNDDKKIKEFDVKYHDIVHAFEWELELISIAYRFTWKTPPHDIVGWIMNEIVELEKVEK